LTALVGARGTPPHAGAMAAARAQKEPTLSLHLEETDPEVAQRPLLSYKGKTTGWSPHAALVAAAAAPLPLKALELDPLTAKDDPKFGAAIQAEKNLPDWLKAGLKKAF